MKHRGLIVLVGTGRPGEDPMSQSAGIAIEYHMSAGQESGLEMCWLIATAGESGSLPIAQKLKEACQARNVKADIRTVSDPFSVQESYDLVQRIYDEEVPKASLSEREVIADFTGGVKPMSAGMILACGDRRPMQYMYGRKEGIASIPRIIEFAQRGRRESRKT
jgi:CRISPR/Cas system-associated protein Csm6